MFAYCGNNPSIYSDPRGEFPWLIVGIIVCSGLVGGVAGYFSEEKLGVTPPETVPNSSGEPKHPSEITEDDLVQPELLANEPLTTADRVYNAFLGATVGIAVGGAVVAGAGAVATVAAGSGATFIPAFGATAYQTFAYGALAYNSVGMVFAPLLGMEMEAMEAG